MRSPGGNNMRGRQDGADLRREIERLQVLVGERGTPQATAVRRGDVARIGVIALTAAHAAGATPTAAEFNALVDDVKTLAAIIERIGAAFSG